MIRPASIGFARHSPKTGSSSFDVEWVRQLSEGLARLSQGGIDAVLLELSLPDSHGIETFDKLFSAAPDVPDDSPIVSAIIDMGKNLKQRVIAEGVETQGQLAFLRAQRCAEGQGYLFSRPLAAAQFAYLLQTGLTETVLH